MAKKRTKADEQKALLKQRLADMARGAHGGYGLTDFDSDEFIGMASELGLDGFGRWVGAIKVAFLTEENEYLVEPNNLEHYDTIDKAVEMLWRNGVRP